LLSKIPARSHWRISLRMRGSAILCATIRNSQSWSTESKKAANVGWSPCRHHHPVDPRTGQPLLSAERPLERHDVAMVQQGSEPGLGGLPGRRVHPRQVGQQG
jgi:hypothetical protein